MAVCVTLHQKHKRQPELLANHRIFNKRILLSPTLPPSVLLQRYRSSPSHGCVEKDESSTTWHTMYRKDKELGQLLHIANARLQKGRMPEDLRMRDFFARFDAQAAAITSAASEEQALERPQRPRTACGRGWEQKISPNKKRRPLSAPAGSTAKHRMPKDKAAPALPKPVAASHEACGAEESDLYGDLNAQVRELQQIRHALKVWHSLGEDCPDTQEASMGTAHV
jgi:hypothetical protein